jgi:hypothetical protein
MNLKTIILIGATCLLAGCSYQLPMGKDYGCTAAHGGDPRRCWQALNLDNPRPATGSSYHSAGTMSLAHATCVRPESHWWFHGAHNPFTKQISSEGNSALLNAYRTRYPQVASYLESKGALQTTSWTKLTGRDLNQLGVPLCRN